jgi:hypothetical protein
MRFIKIPAPSGINLLWIFFPKQQSKSSPLEVEINELDLCAKSPQRKSNQAQANMMLLINVGHGFSRIKTTCFCTSKSNFRVARHSGVRTGTIMAL